MVEIITWLAFVTVIGGLMMTLLNVQKKRRRVHQKLEEAFPPAWRNLLEKDVRFYAALEQADKMTFEKRVQLFLATKSIEGVEVLLNDELRLKVACSAVIPTFAFPDYNYPYVHSVLIYPGSFNLKFETTSAGTAKRDILGMVGSNIQDGTVILSKPELLAGFDGKAHEENVGIHEFVHLLDKEDGEIDGLPKMLLDHAYVGPWLHEIKNEIKRIEKGESDISPYALTNNAEFLAVVSEYFFTNPEKFERKHPDLYNYLCKIFKPHQANLSS